jgi:hypothetical protein
MKIKETVCSKEIIMLRKMGFVFVVLVTAFILSVIAAIAFGITMSYA